MFSYQTFEDVFNFDPEYSYDQAVIQAIDTHRKTLEGLFVDKVLKMLGIKRPVKLYPPKSNADLRSLHQAVVASNAADHHKISVLYYILLDTDTSTGKRYHSASFEESSFLPAKYQIYMKGLWHMDRLEFEVALQYLTHPSLIPTFADEILEVLVHHAKDGDVALPLAYYHTVQPTLTATGALESLFSAIVRASVTEAFYFCRSQSDYAHRHMFEMLISLVLNNSPKRTVSDRSVELVNLPMTQEEEGWFEEYLCGGEGRSIRKGRDTVMMRRIGIGKFTKLLSLDNLNGRSIGGLDWDMMLEGIQNGLGARLDV